MGGVAVVVEAVVGTAARGQEVSDYLAQLNDEGLQDRTLHRPCRKEPPKVQNQNLTMVLL